MQQEKEIMEVTPEEKELIESIRNYNKPFQTVILNYFGSHSSCSTICFDSLTFKEK